MKKLILILLFIPFLLGAKNPEYREINILNTHSHPQQGDNWEVSFTTQGRADLKIIPNDQATIDDDEFIGLWCGDKKRTPQILPGGVIYYPDWQCSDIVKVVHFTKKSGKHTLRFEFGGQVAYAYNQAWLSGWAKRVKLTIDQTDIDADLTDFPVLVHLSAASGRMTPQDDVSFVFDELQNDANSKKIAVTASDGTTQRYVEIEKWDDANEQAWLWVKVPTVSGTVDTDLYLYYDSTQADNTTYVGDPNSTPAENVWDTYFKGVWHLPENPAGTAPQMKDSTSNNGDGTSAGTMTSGDQVAGKVNGSLDFDGSDDTINIPDSTNWTLSSGIDLTMEGWFNFNTLLISGDWDSIIGNPVVDTYSFQFSYDGGVKLNWWDGTIDHPSPVISISTGVWYHYVLTLDFGVTNGSHWYLNGADLGAFTAENRSEDPTALKIGAGCDALEQFTGKLDEVRFSKTLRTATWVKADYETGRDHLLDFGSQELAAASQVYYSVGQSSSNLMSGSPSVTISSGVATFTEAQTGNIGVGDRVTYSGSTASTGAKVITAVNSSTNWTSATVANLNSSNNVRGYTTQTSFADLIVSGFDFSAVPSGSIINGIEVKVEFSNSYASTISTIHCALSYDGTNYTAATADQTVTGTTDATKTYGGSTDTWTRTWSVTELSTSNFRLKVSGKSSSASYQCRVDYITANVYYTPPLVAYISGKASLDKTQWTLVTATGGTPADVGTAATVSSIAHEYTSLSAALPSGSTGAKDASHLNTSDLVTGNYVLNIPCYNDAGAADTTTVNIDNWTVDASHYIRVYTPNNTSTECNTNQRHAGKWDDAKYRMSFSSGWQYTYYGIGLNRPIRFEGIQFAIDPDADDRIIINVNWDDGGATHDYIFNSCIFKSLDTDGTYYAKAFREFAHTGTAVNFKIYNCVFYDFVKTTYGFAIEAGSGCVDNFYIYNCTFHNNYTGVYCTAGTIVMKNCLFTGNTTADASGTFAAGTDYNATNRASIGYTVTGSGNTHDRLSRTFTFVDEDNHDFHLASNDTGAKDYGTNLSADANIAFSTDIDGDSRPFGSAWDIGADECMEAAVARRIIFID